MLPDIGAVIDFFEFKEKFHIVGLSKEGRLKTLILQLDLKDVVFEKLKDQFGTAMEQKILIVLDEIGIKNADDLNDEIMKPFENGAKLEGIGIHYDIESESGQKMVQAYYENYGLKVNDPGILTILKIKSINMTNHIKKTYGDDV
jgi:trimethylamine:corrinoid methyltransferase-like protein